MLGKESPEVFLFVNFTFFRSDKFGSLIHHQVSDLLHNFLENIFNERSQLGNIVMEIAVQRVVVYMGRLLWQATLSVGSPVY